MTRQKILILIARVIVLLVVIGAFAVLTVKVYGLSGGLQTQQTRLSDALQNQTRNRVGNVARWCTAINHDRRILVSYVAAVQSRVSGVPSLRLQQLPCKQLEKATDASTRSARKINR